jgi:hypothetical protein
LPSSGITNYLLNGGTLEKAQQMAAHESPRMTKLYDRMSALNRFGGGSPSAVRGRMWR